MLCGAGQGRQFGCSYRRTLLSYQYEWKREEAQKNVLRTHTTAITARQLYLLAQQVW